MKVIAVNYNFTPNWLKKYDYLIYDRSDSPDYLDKFEFKRIIHTKNIGNADYDRLKYTSKCAYRLAPHQSDIIN